MLPRCSRRVVGRVADIGPMRLVAVVILVSVASPPADATFCKTRKGAIFVRDTCRRKETAVDLAAIGAAPKGDPGAAGATQTRLRAVDANGQQLPGIVTSSGKMIRTVGTRTLTFDAQPDGFAGASFLFESADCTGAPLLSAYDKVSDQAAISGTTAYYGGDPVAEHTIRSVLRRSTPQNCSGAGETYDPATGLCCEDQSTSPSVYTAGPATPVDLGSFTPPLHVEFEE